MSNIIMLQLTREEAAVGAYRTINTATGPTMIHVPPVQDGMVIRVATANGEELYARIQIVGGQPGAAPAKSKAPVIVLVSVAAVVAVGVTLGLTLGQHNSPVSDPTANPVVSQTTDSATTPAPYDSATDTPAPSDTYQPPVTDPTSPSESPFTDGSCLNGTLPDSTTAQAVSDVNVVDCGASDAHYKIIQTFPFTDDLHQCDSNPKTQYEFSETRTWGGATLMSTVYCVVGLGSYDRS
ncbi:hypothetical protein E6W39_05500 [Kitasatospora acidiphila]|uniref:Uncharacterized protein n=1 Tax=Kitasatospora acidiphila TaxID=2567942 RepID=A0A540VYK5_9ACTN|nr:hypothetical protein [Kitasatospora acidiphila]TQF01811.1 hypothetical protein E6W39_05500 [Kitasatospora acidiphila]